jgi:rubredoxin
VPIRYRCRNCGAVLYVFEKIGDPLGLLTPREVAFTYNFTCPVCKSQLNPNTTNPDWREHIRIKQAEITREKCERKRESSEKRESETTDFSGVTFLSSTEFIVDEY